MDYILITALQLIGIGLHVAQKVMQIDNRDQTDTPRQVLGVFLTENWPTMFVSGLVLVLNLVAHFILASYTDLPNRVSYYAIYAFGGALVLGYAGQRLIYKFLGAAEAVVSKRVEARLNIEEVAAKKAEDTLK